MKINTSLFLKEIIDDFEEDRLNIYQLNLINDLYLKYKFSNNLYIKSDIDEDRDILNLIILFMFIVYISKHEKYLLIQNKEEDKKKQFYLDYDLTEYPKRCR